MRHLDVASAQLPQQLAVVVAHHAQRTASLDHAHHQFQHVGRARSTIDKIADEYNLSPLRMMTDCPDFSGTHTLGNDVAKEPQQGEQLVIAAVDIADEVEGTVFVALVGPQRLALDDDTLNLF